MTQLEQQTHFPKHIAIIMDGNGRWAETKGRKRSAGHQQGVKALRTAITFAAEHHFEALTVFAFSSENWKRPQSEVDILMQLFLTALGREANKLKKNNIQLKVIGDVSGFNLPLQKKIKEIESLTAGNTGLRLNIAANYGGRWDIVEAAKKMAHLVKLGETEVNDITETSFNKHITLSELADVDLLIRTGGERRISNFLLWQSAYTELFFSDVLWPDFNDEQFQAALDFFAKKERRFGKTSAQIQ